MLPDVLKTYKSKSKPGQVHEVRLGKDGVTYCTCWAWRRNRTCWHLEDYLGTKKAGNTKVYPNQPTHVSQAVSEVIKIIRSRNVSKNV